MTDNKLESPELQLRNQEVREEDNVLIKPSYMREFANLTENTFKGVSGSKRLSVAQLSNGDVVITELRICDVYYKWDDKKQRLIRTSSVRTRKKTKDDDGLDLDIHHSHSEDFYEEEVA